MKWPSVGHFTAITALCIYSTMMLIASMRTQQHTNIRITTRTKQ